MNNLKIQVTIPSLSSLTSVGTNQYQVVAKFFTSTGSPLNNPNINNVSTIIVTTTTTAFDVNVPVIDGNWSITNAVVKIFSNNDSSCCFATDDFSITNTQTQEPGQNSLEVVAYFSQ